MDKVRVDRNTFVLAIAGLLTLVALYLISQYNYLLFHGIVELSSVIVIGCIFVITWNSRKYINNNYLIFIGIAYLFVGFIEFLHMMSYTGMNIFYQHDTNLPTQLWLAMKFMESVSLLIAPFFLGRKMEANKVFISYALVTALVLASIFSGVFPAAFIDGRGLTPFKVYSEYMIVAILVMSLLLLHRARSQFDDRIYKLLLFSIIATGLAELPFTLYSSPFDILNFAGHVLMVISFYFIYRAIIVTGIEKPYDIIFRDLAKSERELREAKGQAELYIDLMAHDINNMNQVSMGYLELALESDKLDKESRIEIAHALDHIKSSSALISNVRKIQQVKSGMLQQKPIDVCSLLEEVRAQFSRIPDKAVAINCSLENKCKVRANELLKDVFVNIVGNAIKHGDNDVAINILVSGVRKDGRSYCRVDIEDNGPGIPDEMKADIFNRLKRGDTKAKGSGLGLYLVKALVNGFEGMVWVEDRVNGDRTKGSRFVVMLPSV